MTELRVTLIDESCFAVEVTAGDPTQVDWRRSLGRGATFKPFTLSPELGQMLSVLMERLGLRFGAIDIIIDKQGTPIFLEVNPQGAYLWLEEQLGLPITAAMADALCSTQQ